MTQPIQGIHITNFWQLLKLVRQLQVDMIGTLNHWFETHGTTVAFYVNQRTEFQTIDPNLAYEVLVKQASSFVKDNDYTDKERGLARFFGNGLLTSNGDFWKRQRKLVAPALHTKRIDAYAETMVDHTLEQISGWRDGQTVHVTQEMNALTMRIIAKTMFNTDVRADIERMRGALMDVQSKAIDMQMNPMPMWIPTPGKVRADQAVRTLNEFVYRTIANWKQTGQDNGDLLSMLLLARDENDQPMTDEQARDEVLTLFLAGFETTANTLNWTWMLLSQNPHVAQKLHQELDTVLAGRTPTLDDLKRLSYVDMVIKEALRLYPPAYSYSRSAIQDVTIGDLDIRKNTKVGIYTYGMHRRADLWENANEFMPERWAKENESRIPKGAYLPFGGGPRVCIGNAFALMEASLILATIASRYELHLNSTQPVAMFPAITLNPKGTLPMQVRVRQTVAQAQPTH